MRLYINLFFSVLLLLSACGDKNEVPKGIIPRDKMVNLLTDVHIVDGTVTTVIQVPDSLYKYGTGRYLDLFKKYHTDSVQFRKSVQYYTTRPEMLVEMYDEVSKKIARKNDSIFKIKPDAVPHK